MFSNRYIQAPGDGRLATTSVFSANSEPNFLHGFLKNGHWTRGKGLWAAFRIFSDTKKYPLNFYFELVKNNKILSAVRICFYINKEGFLTPLCMTLRFYISEVFWLLPRLGLCFCFCFFFLAPPFSDRILIAACLLCSVQYLFDQKQTSLLLVLVQREVPQDCLLFSNWSISWAWLISKLPSTHAPAVLPMQCWAVGNTLYWLWNKKLNVEC